MEKKTSLTEMVALIAGISILLSVTYNMGFYSLINGVFFKFLSIQDHLVSALPWLVVGLPISAVTYLLFSLSISKSVNTPKKVLVFALISILSYEIGSHGYQIYHHFDQYSIIEEVSKSFGGIGFWILLVVVCYLFFLPSIFKLLRPEVSGGRFEAYVISLLIPMMGISYESGVSKAANMIIDCEALIKQGKPKKMFLPIASNDKGIVFFGPTCSVGFATWGEIKAIGNDISKDKTKLHNKTSGRSKSST